jgi:hypothetical protein
MQSDVSVAEDTKMQAGSTHPAEEICCRSIWRSFSMANWRWYHAHDTAAISPIDGVPNLLSLSGLDR